jgi:two-component system, OmpR family, response regulator
MDTILVVDDDPHIREVVSFALEKAGYAVAIAENGVKALEAFARKRPALLVLDIMMPEMDGIEVCRRLRSQPAGAEVPILFVSAKDDEVDRIIGLELGGDDYVAKPFSPRELVARVKAILRRAARTGISEGPARLSHGHLSLDLERYEAHWDGKDVVLTLTEFGILRTLMERPGKVCNRDHLMNSAYELHKVVSDRTIDSHVRRVRAKFAAIGAEPIETLHGVGYRLGPCE